MENTFIPKGFHLVESTVTGKMVLRPEKGFSDNYLTTNCFIPVNVNNSDVEDDVDNDFEQDDISGVTNLRLRRAKSNKKDEFYTSLNDIIVELKHYQEFFKGKVVYCPCDKVFNVGRSNFFVYFAQMFKTLGIKQLICTQYNPDGCAENEIFGKHGIRWDYYGEISAYSPIDESDVDVTLLDGDGSFDSQECIDIMKECDVVVTNPPFSLFRQFINQLDELGKKFIILGNNNAITYKDVFSLIMANKLWLGYDYNKTMPFVLPDDYEQYDRIECGRKIGNVPAITWFTNININKRHESIYLYSHYNDKAYPKYDNYDAIEVSKVAEIPCDYDGVMGVPITFLGSHNPDQFELIGGFNGYKECDYENGLICGTMTEYKDSKTGKMKQWTGPTVNKKTVYYRILIRKKK